MSPLIGQAPDDVLSQLGVYHAHNQVFQSLLESGIPGLLALLFLVFAVVWTLARAPQARAARLALALVLFADMMIEVPLSNPLNGASFAVVFAVLLIGSFGSPSSQSATSPSHMPAAKPAAKPAAPRRALS
jgi:O-antigen ligase